LALGTVAALAIGLALRFLNPRRVLWFSYVGQPLASGEFAKLAEHPKWRGRSLELDAGVRLVGLERPAEKAGAPWVLYFGGNSAHLLEDGQRFLDRLFSGTDWGGAVWAYRGYDGSSGAPDPAWLEQDAWIVLQRALREQHLDAGRIALVGFSLGTSIASSTAARAQDLGPLSVVLMAPVTEIEMRPRAGYGKHRYETLRFLEKLAGPVLVLQGEADQTLPPEWGRLIANRLGARARYAGFPGVGHLDLPESDAAVDVARTFLAERFR
jgi:pimeloyl-ACP methyl ester carboxylesterase